MKIVTSVILVFVITFDNCSSQWVWNQNLDSKTNIQTPVRDDEDKFYIGSNSRYPSVGSSCEF